MLLRGGRSDGESPSAGLIHGQSLMALADGPYVGGLLIVDRSYAPLLWFGVIAVSACYACFLGAIRLGGAATLRALSIASAIGKG